MPQCKKYFTVYQKLVMVETVGERQVQEPETSLRQIARDLGVDPKQLRRWKEQSNDFKVYIAQRRRHVQALHPGGKSQLLEIEEDLLRFIFESREQGYPVSVRMVVAKASELNPDFRCKSDCAKGSAVRRFVKSHGLVHRVHTHESQRLAAEVEGEATEFINSIRPLMVQPCRQNDFILNMDQTPIFFSMIPRTTLNVLGARTVNVRTCTSSTMRATVAVCVTASGKMLPPLVIFKGKPGGRIEREFITYNNGGFYAVQQKAWMDEQIMLLWIERILQPYVSTASKGILPLLFLDSYRCHQMSSIIASTEQAGVEVKHIPAGCTGLCQPIDVGIGKPLKDRIRHIFEDWMINQGVTARINTPTRKDMAEWIVTTLLSLDETLIKNSWRHDCFSYFQVENIEADPTVDAGDDERNENAH